MAKSKREVIGKVLKGKDGKADYIQVSRDVTLKKDEYLNLESKKSKLEGLSKAAADGKLTGELLDKLVAQAEAMPDFIRFEIVKVTKID